MNNNHIVYKHTNKINGKIYIGQTCNLRERWRGNGKNYFGSIKFFNAIKKYGWDSFEHEILYSGLSKEEANTIERRLIAEYDTINNGYNICFGGHTDLPPESLAKMSESLKRGYIEHPERRDKISKARKGKKHINTTIEQHRGIRSPKSILVTIDNVTGSIRFWSSTLKKNRYSLTKAYRNGGIDGLTAYIKELCEKREVLV